MASDPVRFKPRVETGVKAGTQRFILQNEAWVPLVQDAGRRVLYTDIRFSADDNDGTEQNIGVGYRTLNGRAVHGVHGWLDRRTTENGSIFYQNTVGVEYLSDPLDLRVNGYIPLSGKRSYSTPNQGGQSPYLAGTGLFVDTQGQAVEEPQPGFDIEIGTRIPYLDDVFDNARAYATFYHFEGETSKDVTGTRARMTADINGRYQIGARYQHDDVRGSQGFLEMTMRFPAKKSHKKHGMHARLDESPERDIDIVTGSTIIDDGLRTPVINTQTKATQRILHVDNTVNAGGNGSVENPFSTLVEAETVQQAYDIIYVRGGNGTSAGMNTGINLYQRGVQLIGQAAPFYYDQGMFTTQSGRGPASTLIAAAGARPVLSNTAGNGVTIAADDVRVTGVSVANATVAGIVGTNVNNSQLSNLIIRNNGSAGIYIAADNGSVGDVSLSDIVSQNNVDRGIWVVALNNGTMGNVRADNIQAYGNGFRGVNIESSGVGSTIGNMHVTNSISNQNTSSGVTLGAFNGATSGDILIENVTAHGNTSTGLNLIATGGAGQSRTGDITIRNTDLRSNGGNGVYLITESNDIMGDIAIDNMLTQGNTSAGVSISADGANAVTGDIAITNSTSSGSTSSRGITIAASSAGSIGNVLLDGLTITGNATRGVNVESSGTGSRLGNVTLNNSVVSNNLGDIGVALAAWSNSITGNVTVTNTRLQNSGSRGLNIFSNGSSVASTLGDVSVSNVISTGHSAGGIRIEAGTDDAIGVISITDSIASNNTTQGINVTGTTFQTIDSVIIRNNITQNNAGAGINVGIQTNADINTVVIEGNLSTGNTSGSGSGISVSNAGAGSTIGTLNISNNVTRLNAVRGINLSAGTSSLITNATISGNDMTSNTGNGLRVVASGGGDITGLDVLNNTANQNATTGIYVESNSLSSKIDTITLDGNTTNSNTGDGTIAYIAASASDFIEIKNSTARNNASDGFQIQSEAVGSLISSVVLENLVAENNTASGVFFVNSNSGNTANIDISDLTLTNNILDGLSFAVGNTTGNGSITGLATITDIHATGNRNGINLAGSNSGALRASVSNSSLTGNTEYGVDVDDDTSGVWNVDLGGGVYASTGGNRIFGNTLHDVFVDMDGAQLKAQSNWWGQAGGPLGADINLNNGTLDSANALATDPSN